MGFLRSNVKLLGPVAWGVVLPLATAFLMFATGMYLYANLGPGTVSATDRYDVLRDTLTIVLSVAAVVIAVLGLGAFALRRVLLQRYVSDEVGERFQRVMCWNLINLGYTMWDQYENTQEPFLLRHAIELTADAYKPAGELDMTKRPNQEIVRVIRNNWGYFLAEKARAAVDGDTERFQVTQEEQDLALALARELESSIPNLAEHAEDLFDTIGHIRRYCVGSAVPDSR